MFARLYASTACESCESISRIWFRTFWACARFAETEGSAAADLTDAPATATRIAASRMRSAGACLSRELMPFSYRETTGVDRLRRPLGGQICHKHGTLAAGTDDRKP